MCAAKSKSSGDADLSPCSAQFERKRYMQDWSQERGPFCGFHCYAEWQAENTRGDANPFHNPDCWIMLACHRSGKELRRRRLTHQRQASATGRAFCSRQCFEDHARMSFPRHSYNWTSKVWQRARRHPLKRDGFQCQDCGEIQDLTVHHLRRPLANIPVAITPPINWTIF